MFSRTTLGVAIALLAAAAPAGAQVAPPDPGRPPLDVRELGPDPAPLPATRAEIRGREELSDRLGRQGVLEFDSRTNSARVVAKLDGFLTGPSSADAADVALGFVRANPETFGLSAAEVDRLKVVRRYTSGGGITHLVWAQSFDGIVAWGNELLANVTEDGRLINVSGSPVADLRTRTTEPELSAREARERARDDAGASGNRPRGDARLVLFTERPGDTHLAWHVTANKDYDELYEYLVDARDGRLLFRRNTVDNAAATIHAWEYAPDIDLSVPALPDDVGLQQAQTTLFGGDPVQVDSATALIGPYARVYPDQDDDDQPDAQVPASTGTTWDDPVVRFAAPGSVACPNGFTTQPGEFACTWGNGAAGNPSNTSNLRQNAAQVYFFVNNFHDWLEKEPNIAFDDASGNFEAADGDAVEAQVFDGTALLDNDHLNNANMGTPPDGSPPRMQMFLFRGRPGEVPHANGGDDASVIYHEYGHGLSNRLVTGGTGASTLNTHQSDSMGEGWSDWYAMDYLESQGIEVADTVGDQGQMIMGRYLFANDPDGLRFRPLDCPVTGVAEAECAGPTVGAGDGGFTYGDLGKIFTEPEVHADGEIWAQALWDLRQALTPQTARRLITDGMRLSPPAPSFLDMRNAILQADVVAFGGANRNAIWSVFAARGMGASASTTSGNDTSPAEAFDVPGPGVTVSGRVTDAATGGGIANAYIQFEAGGAPGDYATRSDSNGNYSITDVPPATFARVLVGAPGFALSERTGVAAGGGIDFALAKNFAATASGATIDSFTGPNFTGDGCGPGGLIDGTLATGWGSTSHNHPTASLAGVKSAVVKLPEPVDVSAILVDPSAICGDGPSASTAQFRVEVSSDGVSFSPYAESTFDGSNLGKLNTVGAGAKGVRFVRYSMLTPQRQTGAPDGPGGISGVLFLDTTELEVHGAPAAAPPPGGSAPPGGSPPPPSGPGPANPIVDRIAPTPRIVLVKRQKLKTALSKGIKFTVACNEACSFSASATIDAKTAKKLKLITRNSRAKTFKVASGSVKLGQGQRTATLKFARKRKAKLKKLKSVKLTITWTVKDASGNSRKTTTKATLKR